MFPLVFASLSDAVVALGRISKFLTAEELADSYEIDYERKLAVDVDGDFTWEVAGKLANVGPKSGGSYGEKKQKENAKQKRKVENRGSKQVKAPVLPTTADDDKFDSMVEEENEKKPDETPFELRNLKFKVPKGAFVAIVGRVGSGKVTPFLLNLELFAKPFLKFQSSLLQALIGEMRRTKGYVRRFCSPLLRMSYSQFSRLFLVDQSLMSRKLRGFAMQLFEGTFFLVERMMMISKLDSFVRGPDRKFIIRRFWDIIRACSLEHDLDMLPNREQTEIGEKGINLSGLLLLSSRPSVLLTQLK
jgi:ATP-binding cassette subfamily C (CFTR/MRP) protein 1